MMIDIDRCLRAMQDINIEGACVTVSRRDLVAAAIAMIQADPASALKSKYLGIKNYASFGDQREDHQYGMGPRHGSIVFRIGRKHDKNDVVLGADHIYLLECVRDADPINEMNGDPLVRNRHRPSTMNLTGALRRWEKYRELGSAYYDAVASQQVHPHE